MMRSLRRFAGAIALALLAAGPLPAAGPVAPPEHRRGAEQTFLTYPEWFLVHSPAEYAAFVQSNSPSDFPWFGHIGQLWSSYFAVTRASAGQPFNAGYHVMILVIGVSTTVEYALRAAYETVIGRLSALAMPPAMTAEDRYAARAAQDYVDFIRVRPWYEFDFFGALTGLWRDTPAWGPGMPRKWERRYALSTEYIVKAIYGWLIGLGTAASYEAARPDTAVLLDGLPPSVSELRTLEVLALAPRGRALVAVPRYAAFRDHALLLARGGANFIEIAGNRGDILISLRVPADWSAAPAQTRVLFEQPILTQPGRKRVALVVPVAALGRVLRTLGAQVEHVYDY
ncbi:MAG: hypothetical protein R3357_04030 [Burkholderiales bacterium]|nr:hypothetical protein [Burkholderiales bacterium]